MNSSTSSFKVCPRCSNSAHLQAAYCTVCGHQFTTSFQQFQGHPHPHWDPYAAQRPDSNRLLVTILLWFFLGNFGAHRFYLGHTSTAVTMLVLNLIGWATACFLVGYVFLLAVAIWWIIDLVQMLTGQLRPIDGTRIV